MRDEHLIIYERVKGNTSFPIHSYTNGVAIRDLAETFKISRERVRIICKKMRFEGNAGRS